MGRSASRDTTAVADVLAALDEPTAADSRVLMAMMQRISGHEPRVWNVATLGFDSYHYTYDSGREGDAHALGFYPRKGRITVYLMDGTQRHADLLAGLGKHTTSRVCLYLEGLGDVDLSVLEQIVQQSYDYVKAHDGRMHRA
jgi:hypothetical protein